MALIDPRCIDMTGEVCHRLTVIEHAGSYRKPSGSSMALWWCKCICGKRVVASGAALRSGATKSCGCARVDANRVRSAARKGRPAAEWSKRKAPI